MGTRGRLAAIAALTCALWAVAPASGQAATAITASPSDPTTATTASFTFEYNGPAVVTGFICQLDAAMPASCPATAAPPPVQGSVVYSMLTEGRHTFKVHATGVGVDSSDAVYSWTVDVVPGPPDTTITAGPSGTATSGSAHFEFTSSQPGSTFRCSGDGGSARACTSPLDFTGLADGPHTFSVTAVDGAGNSDPTPAVRTWTVATTGGGGGGGGGGLASPTAAVALKTRHPVQRAGVRLSAAASRAPAGTVLDHFRWDYGDGFQETTTSPETIHAYRRAGRFTVRVVAFDALGRASSPARLAVTVADGDPPSVAISSPKQGDRVSRSRAIVLRGRASDASGVRSVRLALRPLRLGSTNVRGCRWFSRGALRAGSCARPRTFAARLSKGRWSAVVAARRLPRGVYELRVIATDRSGLRSTVLTVEARTILSFAVV